MTVTDAGEAPTRSQTVTATAGRTGGGDSGPSVRGQGRRWTKSGTVVEVLPYDAYQVRIHGSRHVSKRYRSHLRKIAPFTPEVKLYPAASPEAQTAPQTGL